MVEKVEEFRTELESVTLLEPPILRQRKVDVRDRFSSDYTLAQRAELSDRGYRKCRRIQMESWIIVRDIEADRYSSDVARRLLPYPACLFRW